MFFFEKKNQKTFSPERSEGSTLPHLKDKVFLLLFVHKKKILPS